MLNHIREYQKSNTKSLLLDLVQQIRMGIKPHFTFEMLDILEVTFRAQNEVMNLAETTNLYGNEIVNMAMDMPYLYRFESCKNPNVLLI